MRVLFGNIYFIAPQYVYVYIRKLYSISLHMTFSKVFGIFPSIPSSTPPSHTTIHLSFPVLFPDFPIITVYVISRSLNYTFLPKGHLLVT